MVNEPRSFLVSCHTELSTAGRLGNWDPPKKIQVHEFAFIRHAHLTVCVIPSLVTTERCREIQENLTKREAFSTTIFGSVIQTWLSPHLSSITQINSACYAAMALQLLRLAEMGE